jgi:hypothetical protein
LAVGGADCEPRVRRWLLARSPEIVSTPGHCLRARLKEDVVERKRRVMLPMSLEWQTYALMAAVLVLVLLAAVFLMVW